MAKLGGFAWTYFPRKFVTSKPFFKLFWVGPPLLPTHPPTQNKDIKELYVWLEYWGIKLLELIGLGINTRAELTVRRWGYSSRVQIHAMHTYSSITPVVMPY